MGTFYASEHEYEIVQIHLDGVTVEVARAIANTQGNWVARTAPAMAGGGNGSVTAWEYEAGWLLYHPEINRIMAQHFAHRSPVEQYKSRQERTCHIDVTVNLAANRGFRTNGYCLMSESFTLSSSFSSSSSVAQSRHRRVSPFFKSREEAEQVLALVEEQEHFGVATAVVPTRPYCLLLPTRTRSRTGMNSAGSELNKNLSYYITAGDANSCLYDTDIGSSGSTNEYNPWDVR